MERKETVALPLLGISMPIADLFGMGASILTPAGAARWRARSSARPVNLLIFTPGAGATSYLVTDGPGMILRRLASTLKLLSALISFSP